jgi:hypothetical protein
MNEQRPLLGPFPRVTTLWMHVPHTGGWYFRLNDGVPEMAPVRNDEVPAGAKVEEVFDSYPMNWGRFDYQAQDCVESALRSMARKVAHEPLPVERQLSDKTSAPILCCDFLLMVWTPEGPISLSRSTLSGRYILAVPDRPPVYLSEHNLRVVELTDAWRDDIGPFTQALSEHFTRDWPIIVHSHFPEAYDEGGNRRAALR